jgi:hypothetical protein
MSERAVEKLIYTHDELCESLGWSKYQLKIYRDQGVLKPLPNRKPLMFTKESVQAFLETIQNDDGIGKK